MTPVEIARKTLNDLETKLGDNKAWQLEIETASKSVSFEAHTAGGEARERLDNLNAQSIAAEQEAASLEIAIAEGKQRVAAAVAAETDAEQRSRATRALALLSAFEVRGEALQQSLDKFLANYAQLSNDFHELDKLGCAPTTWLGLTVDLRVAAADMKLAREVILERAAQVLLESIKETIGNDAYTYGWLPLAPSTIERKGFDRPLFETGELQASYTYVMALNKRETWVGSNNPKAVWHEWGTGGPHPVPPRPVLQGAWDYNRAEIEVMAGRTMWSIVAAGALRSRELRELIHLANKVYHEVEEFDRTMDEHTRRE